MTTCACGTKLYHVILDCRFPDRTGEKAGKGKPPRDSFTAIGSDVSSSARAVNLIDERSKQFCSETFYELFFITRYI